MFKPQTEKIGILQSLYQERIKKLENDIFFGNTNIYIDYANARNWYEKLGWCIDLKRLKKFLSSFGNIKSIKFYQGTLIGDKKSEEEIQNITDLGFELKTKPVKIMRHSI